MIGTGLERAALSFTRFTEARKHMESVLNATPEQEIALRIHRKNHIEDLQTEIDAMYRIMLEYLDEDNVKTDKALAEMSRLAQESGSYD